MLSADNARGLALPDDDLVLPFRTVRSDVVDARSAVVTGAATGIGRAIAGSSTIGARQPSKSVATSSRWVSLTSAMAAVTSLGSRAIASAT